MSSRAGPLDSNISTANLIAAGACRAGPRGKPLHKPVHTAPPADARLPTWQLLVFGFPAMPHAFVALPLYSILPTYYAANTAVTLAAIGGIAALSRIFDALNDPIIGYLSDRTKTRWGSRKPWIVAAILFCAASIVQLFQPPPDATIVYFAIWSTVLYTGFTMFEIPRSAWSSELSRDYRERSRITMYVALFNIAGSATFYAVPIVMSFLALGDGRIDGSTLGIIALIYIIVLPVSLLLCVWLVPQGQDVATKQPTFRVVIASLWKSMPLLRYCVIITAWGLGQGALMSTVFIFQTDYMGFETEFVYIMLTLFVFQICALPLWSEILKRVDRHRLWCACIAATALTTPLILLFPRGPESLVPALILVALKGVLMAPQNFLPTAVLSDVIDYDTMKTGANKAANFFAFQNIVIKIAMAVGGALAFFILDLAGYRVGQENSAEADTGLLIAYMAVPIAFHVLMLALCWNFPIDSRRHAIIKRRLQSRAPMPLPDPAQAAG